METKVAARKSKVGLKGTRYNEGVHWEWSLTKRGEWNMFVKLILSTWSTSIQMGKLTIKCYHIIESRLEFSRRLILENVYQEFFFKSNNRFFHRIQKFKQNINISSLSSKKKEKEKVILLQKKSWTKIKIDQFIRDKIFLQNVVS